MPSLRNALQIAQAYTWDQSHGYTMGGMGYPDFDCSGFIGRCLNESGFNYPSYHVGTWDMCSLGSDMLGAAGFTEMRYTSSNPIQLQNGDIVVMNHTPLGAGGHTFFYAENIRAYTDPNADSDNIGNVAQAKIEASSDRGHSTSGDHQKNGTGAYWEVWTHAYSSLFGNYDPSDPNDYITIHRWPGGLDDDIYGALLLFKLAMNR